MSNSPPDPTKNYGTQPCNGFWPTSIHRIRCGAMLYEVHVPNPDGSVGRFFVNRQERVRKGDIIEQMTLAYTVRHIEPGTGEVDHVLEVEPLSPTQAEHQDDQST
jgi:hypothetical protein